MENSLPSRLLKTRQGTVAVGIAAAVLAAIVLLVYLSHYRNSVKGSTEPITVLVAKSLITKGTTGGVLATKALFQATTVPKNQLKDGAVTDPALLRGRTAVNDIYPGQQLTIADFTATAASGLSAQLTGPMRAVSIPLDSAHGLIGQVQAGDHVDIYTESGSLIALLLPNVLVVSTPGAPATSTVSSGSGSTSTSNYILEVSSRDAPRIAVASDTTRLWFTLRPASGASPTPRILVKSFGSGK